MFSLFGNNASGPLSASSIKEANEQLQAMHRRISDLEQRICEQIELLERREQENSIIFERMKIQKEAEINHTKQELRRSEENCAKLQGMIKERDVQIAFLLHRCSYLDEAASYAPLLDQLSHCLKGAFAAPPPKCTLNSWRNLQSWEQPKVQTVKPTIPNTQQAQAAVRHGTPQGVTSKAPVESSQSSVQNIHRQPANQAASNQIIKTTNQISFEGKAPVVSYGVPAQK